MPTNFVLIDYENVQPKELALLRDGPYHVKLFLGVQQTKIPVALAVAMQALGKSASYVVLEAAGPNGLDFHIAYYIGVLRAEDPTARFLIISQDTGFEPLIKHLRTRGVIANRFPSLTDIPALKPKHATPKGDLLQVAIALLKSMKHSKPASPQKLRSTLQARFKDLPEKQVDDLLTMLSERGIAKAAGSKVAYNLPV